LRFAIMSEAFTVKSLMILCQFVFTVVPLCYAIKILFAKQIGSTSRHHLNWRETMLLCMSVLGSLVSNPAFGIALTLLVKRMMGMYLDVQMELWILGDMIFELVMTVEILSLLQSAALASGGIQETRKLWLKSLMFLTFISFCTSFCVFAPISECERDVNPAIALVGFFFIVVAIYTVMPLWLALVDFCTSFLTFIGLYDRAFTGYYDTEEENQAFEATRIFWLKSLVFLTFISFCTSFYVFSPRSQCNSAMVFAEIVSIAVVTSNTVLPLWLALVGFYTSFLTFIGLYDRAFIGAFIRLYNRAFTGNYDTDEENQAQTVTFILLHYPYPFFMAFICWCVYSELWKIRGAHSQHQQYMKERIQQMKTLSLVWGLCFTAEILCFAFQYTYLNDLFRYRRYVKDRRQQLHVPLIWEESGTGIDYIFKFFLPARRHVILLALLWNYNKLIISRERKNCAQANSSISSTANQVQNIAQEATKTIPIQNARGEQLGMAPTTARPTWIHAVDVLGPAERNTQGQKFVSPDKWTISVQNFIRLAENIMVTETWRAISAAKGGDTYVTAHDINTHFTIPWTRGTGCSLALLLDSDPGRVQVMLSHSWSGSFQQTVNAVKTLITMHFLPWDTMMFYCAFSQYQVEDGVENGLSIKEQIDMDPFSTVIQAKPEHGMFVIHTTLSEVYERLWCVDEVFEAQKAGIRLFGLFDPDVWSSRDFCEKIKIETKDATCSEESDKMRLREKIKRGGGFAPLDKAIKLFRKQAHTDLGVVLVFQASFGSMDIDVDNAQHATPSVARSAWHTVRSFYEWFSWLRAISDLEKKNLESISAVEAEEGVAPNQQKQKLHYLEGFENDKDAKHRRIDLDSIEEEPALIEEKENSHYLEGLKNNTGVKQRRRMG